MPVLLKENFNRWYSLRSYYLAITISDIPFQVGFAVLTHKNFSKFIIFRRSSASFMCPSFTTSHRNRWSFSDMDCSWQHAYWFRSSRRALVWLLALRWTFKMVFSSRLWCRCRSFSSPDSLCRLMRFPSIWGGLHIYLTFDMDSKPLLWRHTASNARSSNVSKHIATLNLRQQLLKNWTC